MLFTPVNTCKCMKRSVNNLVFPNLSPPPLHSQTPIFLPINFPLDFPDFMGIFNSPGWTIENHPPLQHTKLYRLQRVSFTEGIVYRGYRRVSERIRNKLFLKVKRLRDSN